MAASSAVTLFLVFLCLSETLQAQVEAAKKQTNSKQTNSKQTNTGQINPIPCSKLKDVPEGRIVTASSNYQKWCGSTQGLFLAVEKNKLFYLQCTGAAVQARAKVMFYHVNSYTSNTQLTFDANDVCTVKEQGLSTGVRAKQLADRLEDIYLPYGNSCNAQHYMDYLSWGRVVANVHDDCPVFNTFSASTDVMSPNFRLKGRNKLYALTPDPTTGGLTVIPARGGGRQISNTTVNPATNASNQPKNRGFWRSVSWGSLSKKFGSKNASAPLGVEGKWSKGGGITGSRGGGGRGGTDTSGTGGARTTDYPYSTEAGRVAGRNHASAATSFRPQPSFASVALTSLAATGALRGGLPIGNGAYRLG